MVGVTIREGILTPRIAMMIDGEPDAAAYVCVVMCSVFDQRDPGPEDADVVF